MSRQIRKDILNVRKHKPERHKCVGLFSGTLGWYRHLDKLERGKKYELLRTQKNERKQQQRAKQEQERVRLGGSESPWCGWCN